ncbi:hypothetical protein IE53DRAFT_380068 [Violaceomyces palustris]|uniref:Uncharacterized protein n=1 Tax=Violaceomyces palustris TaxID=1673888 RepID=A0ACD0NW77_9BASI|nr:hypothetical protein IE53DRAFT_380068 [Violaceomyces palustris]
MDANQPGQEQKTDKGKGKSTTRGRDGDLAEPSTSSPGFLSSAMRTARLAQGQVGEALNSLSSDVKAGGGSGRRQGQKLAEEVTEDLRQSSLEGRGSSSRPVGVRGFRSETEEGGDGGREVRFEDFKRSSDRVARGIGSGTLGSLEGRWGEHQPENVGRYSTKSELDEALHYHVRKSNRSDETTRDVLERAWKDPTSARLEERWRGDDEVERGKEEGRKDFIQTLEREEDPMPNTNDKGKDARIRAGMLAREWRPPSPSMPTEVCLTQEQYLLHRDLGLEQDDPEHAWRRSEAILPSDGQGEEGGRSNRGVHAETPEKALESIFGGADPHPRAKSADDPPSIQPLETNHPGMEQERGRELVRLLKNSLPFPTYVDDVYGLPPTLAETMRRATQDVQSEEQAKVREKAIRRLESLWGHLAGRRGVPTTRDDKVKPSFSADLMEEWLKGHP